MSLALRDMPGLRNIAARSREFSEFAGLNILGCVTVTSETGAFVRTLAALGANVRWCSDNQFASDDDVVCYLAGEGIPVFARSNMSATEYFHAMDRARDFPAANTYIETRTMERVEDASKPVTARIYRVESAGTEICVLTLRGSPVVTRTTIDITLQTETFKVVQDQITGLPHDWHEIFPSDHNIDDGFHFPDPWGDASALLTRLAQKISGLVSPPVNHNKISSRRIDKYALDEIHIDSFEGMRVTNDRRTLVWRYFLNLGHELRWTAIVPFDPTVVDDLLSVNYHENYLDPVYAAADWTIPILIVPTPGRQRGRIHALRLCTTHLLHSEYGDRGDLLAVINSLR